MTPPDLDKSVPSSQAAAPAVTPAAAPTEEAGWADMMLASGVLAVLAGFVFRVGVGCWHALFHTDFWGPMPDLAGGWVFKITHYCAVAGMIMVTPRLVMPDKDGRTVPISLFVLGLLTLTYTIPGVFWTVNTIVVIIIALIVLYLLAYLGILQFL